MSEATRILSAIEQGDPSAAEQLLPLVYDELRKLAAARLAAEPAGQTLQPTALVHEAYLRLVGSPGRESGENEPRWDSRGHFFAAAAQAMRRIVVEAARRKKRARHGGGRQRVEIEFADLPTRLPPDDLLALDEALARLEQLDPVKARLVNLRYTVAGGEPNDATEQGDERKQGSCSHGASSRV
jgi:RNA polymerase sigma factor (TIGR02999 family)